MMKRYRYQVIHGAMVFGTNFHTLAAAFDSFIRAITGPWEVTLGVGWEIERYTDDEHGLSFWRMRLGKWVGYPECDPLYANAPEEAYWISRLEKWAMMHNKVGLVNHLLPKRRSVAEAMEAVK